MLVNLIVAIDRCWLPGYLLLRKRAGSRVEISKVPIAWPIYRIIRGNMAQIWVHYRELQERPSMIQTLKFVAGASILDATSI
jgi:hypothetical protein